MLKRFLEEARAIEAELLAGVQFPECATDSVMDVDGEIRVGVIEDPWLKSLFLAYRKRTEALRTAFTPQKLDLREIGGLDGINRMNAEVNRIVGELDTLLQRASELDLLKRILWTELRDAFGVFGTNIGLRAGWTVVKFEEKEEEPRSRVIFGSIDLSALTDVLAMTECDNPDCPIHHPSRVAQA